jgi:hypothetical protein
MTEPTSGLHNPQAAARGVAMGTLLLEALVLLLALAPIRMLSGSLSGGQLAALLGLAAACIATCGLLRRSWGWHVATVLQVLLVLTGIFQWALFVLGAVFLLIWLYVLRVRATVAKPATFDH